MDLFISHSWSAGRQGFEWKVYTVMNPPGWGFRVYVGFRSQGLRFSLRFCLGLGFSLGFSLRFRFHGLGFRVWFRVWFRV